MARVSTPTRTDALLRVVENAAYLLATVATFWFAWVVLSSGHGVGLRMVGLLVAWALLAYLAMPRFNRMMSDIYVPDYFMGRTRTTDGVLGDPVNLALLGTAGQLHQAMDHAGWQLADPITLRSAWGMILSTVTGRSYEHAPVSPLLLFGKRQDFCYQQEVGGNAKQRHHVRFYKCPDDWVLPGGRRVDWLAAGTFDKAVGLSLFTGQVTHKIAADIDRERDHVVETVRAAEPSVTVEVIENFSTGYHSRNGGGDRVHTDGDLPILDLRSCSGTGASLPMDAHARMRDVGARPISVVLAVLLALVLVAVFDVELATALSAEHALDVASGLMMGFMALVAVLLALWTYRGNPFARLLMLLVVSVEVVGSMFWGDAGGNEFWQVAVCLANMYCLTTASARDWVGGEPPLPEIEDLKESLPDVKNLKDLKNLPRSRH